MRRNKAINVSRELFIKTAQELLNGEGVSIIDVGARNKTWELPNIAPLCDVLGFEPNSGEFSKMMTDSTDLELIAQKKDLPYRSIRYLDKAISSAVGYSEFKITEGLGASSLLDPNWRLINQLWHYTLSKNFGDKFRLKSTESLQTTTLDEIAEKYNLSRIDYLKLDVQGSELDCLRGTSALFAEKRVAVIKVEVEFHELYEGQGLFADIDSFLRSQGFMLLTIDFDDIHRVIWSNTRSINNHGTLLWADAFYTLSPDEYFHVAPTDIIKAALVLGEIGYIDLSVLLLKKLAEIDEVALSTLISWWDRDKRSAKERLRDRLRSVMKFIARQLGL